MFCCTNPFEFVSILKCEIPFKLIRIGTKTVSSTLTSIKSNQNPTADTSFASAVNQQQSIVRKRSGSSLISDADSINTCKKRNISYRFMRMKQIQAKHADHVAEIYFLQTGGNMMDFPTWRKKPENQRTPDYLNFSKQYQLESESSTKVTATASTTATTAAIQQVISFHSIVRSSRKLKRILLICSRPYRNIRHRLYQQIRRMALKSKFQALELHRSQYRKHYQRLLYNLVN